MAATVKGTAYIVGIGSTALTNVLPVTYKVSGTEDAVVVRDGHGVAKARVIKSTTRTYTVTGNASTLPTIAAGSVATLTLAQGGTVVIYVTQGTKERSEDATLVTFVGVKESSITYS